MSEIYCQQCRSHKKAGAFPPTGDTNNARRHCNACIEKAAKRANFLSSTRLKDQHLINRTNRKSAGATAELEKFLKRTGGL